MVHSLWTDGEEKALRLGLGTAVDCPAFRITSSAEVPVRNSLQDSLPEEQEQSSCRGGATALQSWCNSTGRCYK